MKTVKLAIVFFLITHSSFAQKLRLATVIKVDSAILKVYGLKFNGNQVTYHLSPSATSRTVRIPRREISRIRYSNGKEELVTITLLPVPLFMIRTSYTNGKISILSTEQKGTKGLRPDRIYMKDRGIIECRIIAIGDKEVKYVVITDSTQQVRTIKRKEIDRLERNNARDTAPVVALEPKIISTPDPVSKKIEKPNVSQKIKKTVESHFRVTLVGNATYLIGNDKWTNPEKGFGHLGGWGSSVIGEYYIGSKSAIGIKIGYSHWKTTIDFKPDSDGPVFKRHIYELTQVPIFGNFRYYIGNHFYLMPEGGFSFTKVKINQIGISDNFCTIQHGCGLTAGYSASINTRLVYDIGGFYRAFSSKVLDPMQYIGIQFALKISLK